MQFDWYEIEHEARDLIDSTAESVVNDYDDEVPIEERILDACGDATLSANSRLILICYYDMSSVFFGDICYEDSPAGEFERDVWNRAFDLMASNKTN